jgi:deoxyxylulose-5-phosphate synthase
MAKIQKKKSGEKIIALNSNESAIVFTNEGIHQILSQTFKTTLLGAQRTQGKSIMERFEKCADKDATSVINDFVLIQVVNLLAEIVEGLKLKK